MSYNVATLSYFDKQLKRLVKKYPSLKIEFQDLIKTLIEKPDTGVCIGDNSYKIRISIKSKGKGKSGGARVITHVRIVHSTVYLMTIYDKSEQENISDEMVSYLLSQIP